MASASKSRSPVSPPAIDDYLAGLPRPQQVALGKLRRAIQAAAPAAREGIRYGLPAFLIGGKFFVGFGATRTGCSFYIGSTLRDFGPALAAYATGKGTIRFATDRPLPASLVRKLVRARLAPRP